VEHLAVAVAVPAVVLVKHREMALLAQFALSGRVTHGRTHPQTQVTCNETVY
jgi:hypothetical protein